MYEGTTHEDMELDFGDELGLYRRSFQNWYAVFCKFAERGIYNHDAAAMLRSAYWKLVSGVNLQGQILKLKCLVATSDATYAEALRIATELEIPELAQHIQRRVPAGHIMEKVDPPCRNVCATAPETRSAKSVSSIPELQT